MKKYNFKWFINHWDYSICRYNRDLLPIRVLLNFDQRHIILFPNGKNKAMHLSFDDGIIKDTSVVKILNKYSLRGTFF